MVRWPKHEVDDFAILLNATAENCVITPPPAIGIKRDGTDVVIDYVGILQSADEVNGPYADVPGATSPRQLTPTAPQKYYRSKQ